MVLTEAHRKSWRDNGFVMIEAFFTDNEVNAVLSGVDRVWERRPADITVDDLVSGERKRASSVPDEHLDRPFKLNDLYLADPAVRSVVSSERVSAIVSELLGDTSVVINSLNFQKGSQQPDHLDTLYMTPLTDADLVATWMALEDTEADAGPLRYWPESQHIEPYRFSNGRLHVVPEEMEGWSQYMATEVDKRGIGDEYFVAQRGDLFIWNAFLLHGGSEICNDELTRKSLVTHFWSRSDCERLGSTTRPVENGGGLWMDRPPQPIPGEPEPEPEPEPAPAAPEPPASNPVGGAHRTLFDRLRSLAWTKDD